MYDKSEVGHLSHLFTDVPSTYPENAYQWLIKVLEGLIDFGNQHGHYGVINLTEHQYEWLDNVLEELIYSVGDNENHILSPLMEFIIRLIGDYEDTYIPKMTDQSSKLVGAPLIQNLSEDELAANAFYSIGYLLYQGNEKVKSLSSCNLAITLQPTFAEAYIIRGMAKCWLNRIWEAKYDLHIAIELAGQQGKENLKTFIQEQLLELSNSTSQIHETKEEA